MALNFKAALGICLFFIAGLCYVVNNVALPSQPSISPAATVGGAALPGERSNFAAGRLERKNPVESQRLAGRRARAVAAAEGAPPETRTVVLPPIVRQETPSFPAALAAQPSAPTPEAHAGEAVVALAPADALLRTRIVEETDQSAWEETPAQARPVTLTAIEAPEPAAPVNPPAAEPVASVAAAGTYKVRKGDSLTRIAQRVFGSSEQRHQQMLIDANPKIAKRVNKLYVGEVLTIPSIPGVAAASERASGQPSGTVAVKQAESDGKKESKPATVAAVAASTTKKKSASADNSGKGTKRTTVAAAQRPSRSGKKGGKASSGGETATERWYTIRGSDSLASIARDVLKDSRRWRELADVNGLRDPNKIIPGMRLKLPPAGPRQG